MARTTSFKLVLLGESAVGKSSLVLRFVRNEFSDFSPFVLLSPFRCCIPYSISRTRTYVVAIDYYPALFNQNIGYKSLAPIYFRNSNAAVIVYDITQTSFEKAKSWVRELQRQADPSIVIMLVGNKTDMDSQRKTSREIGEQYAKEEGLLFAEASAKTGEGVEELFMEIAKKLPLAPPPQRGQAAGGKGVKVSGQEDSATASACTC
ncbi:rab family protein [Cryptococcus deuterogattii 99/473]|uniref:Unplaced genomic scaffold supercont1.6, whole genome shotgun sequence n=1 Tax=Cryptococcus deuterogattii Ram5 TaxID=1296110 RepID=A0A0D0V883_9TREE|nr:rab family protein [Cryptococcus deuterogattii LA55]KIR41070.1 rab family protein [Cryptococcus deuterogattii Ram5]KIR72425.1 rab family protein [Cryptococcus deuterogattii CA1014]KIR92018.1 rab family protein [Cryptococcus deuterogattii CBS 10090]KIR97830.1 rab family protein [Cryptococcus deuterogattii 2001/935-1]KIY57308.1 rab family protein [Cryptococcus deuterogattii 99/473]